MRGETPEHHKHEQSDQSPLEIYCSEILERKGSYSKLEVLKYN